MRLNSEGDFRAKTRTHISANTQCPLTTMNRRSTLILWMKFEIKLNYQLHNIRSLRITSPFSFHRLHCLCWTSLPPRSWPLDKLEIQSLRANISYWVEWNQLAKFRKMTYILNNINKHLMRLYEQNKKENSSPKCLRVYGTKSLKTMARNTFITYH